MLILRQLLGAVLFRHLCLLSVSSGCNTLLIYCLLASLESYNKMVVCVLQCYYYFAVGENLVLRFAWTATVMVQLYSFIDADILATILASLEVFRSYNVNVFNLKHVFHFLCKTWEFCWSCVLCRNCHVYDPSKSSLTYNQKKLILCSMILPIPKCQCTAEQYHLF